MVEAVQTELVLLRGAARELGLTPGTLLAARVLGPAAISLAGVRVPATLPPGLAAGAALRLQVTEATATRLVLKVVGQADGGPAEADAPAAAQTTPAGLPVVPMPGGASAALLSVDADGGSEGPRGARGPRTITVRYESPGVGRVDLALTVDAGMVSAVVHAPAGEVSERLRDGAADLRDALGQSLGRPSRVAVVAREETLDVRV